MVWLAPPGYSGPATFQLESSKVFVSRLFGLLNKIISFQCYLLARLRYILDERPVRSSYSQLNATLTNRSMFNVEIIKNKKIEAKNVLTLFSQ